METLSIQLEPDTRAEVDQLRLQHELKPSRSMYIRSLIERHVAQVTGKTRAADLQDIAAHEVAAANAPRSRAPNASEAIAAASVGGHQHSQALRAIAANNQEKI